MDHNAIPNLNIQQSTPQSSSYSSTPASSRQGQPSIYSPPTTTSFGNPQFPQNPPSRTTTMGSSHAYSRSSPSVGTDQKYVPFSNTPENTKYTGSPSSKYYPPQTPTGAPSHSPLALADIRPRAEMHMGDDSASSGAQLGEPSIAQTNSCYVAQWPIYAYDWNKWPVNTGAGAGKMAICSYLEDPHNFIQILDTQVEMQGQGASGSPEYGLEFTRIAEATCSYPVTRILWEPPSTQKQNDLLATSGDHLRLWTLPGPNSNTASNTITRSSNVNKKQATPQKLTPLALLSNSKTPEHTAPLTSLDWNKQSPKLIITSSIDTTCTIWDIPTLTAKTQLIAHDKEVFDVRFCAGSVDTFVSCGADGSVRMFDLRSLEHSTIIYEPSDKTDKGTSPSSNTSPQSAQQSMAYAPPLLRLAASPHDSHLLATFAQDSKIIRILDHRQPGQALLELHGHSASINCIEWSSTRRGMLSSGADDSLVLYWDLINNQNSASLANLNNGQFPQENGSTTAKGPAASWRCDFEVGNISWAPQSQLTSQGSDWVGVTGGRAVWGVKV